MAAGERRGSLESLTIRIGRSTHDLLRKLSSTSEKTMAQIVDEAVRDYRMKLFWADYHAAYEALHVDSAAWTEVQDERRVWDATLGDGLESQHDERADEQ